MLHLRCLEHWTASQCLTTSFGSTTYVSARPVELAVVFNIKVDDVHSTTAVVLDDLVRAVVRTSTNDPSLRTSLVVLDIERVLADILPPDELRGAVTVAVDTWTSQNNQASLFVVSNAYPQPDSCR